MTNFESLANELLLDIFDYFNGLQLLRLFFDLNTHLNELLYYYFQRHSLDFRSVSKEDFNIVCQQILPSISHQITSIHLSNDDSTPGQPTLFFAYGLQFPHLQSLSLYYIRSTDLIHQILLDCPQLISVKISKCNFDDDMEKAEDLIDQVWNLSKLQSCYLDITFLIDFLIPSPRKVSSSLQCVSIENDPFSFHELIDIFHCTPHLRDLQIRIRDFPKDDRLFLSMPSLTKLKIYFEDSFDHLKTLLENLPNLRELIIEIHNIYIDGYQWEKILCKTLQRFALLMYFKIDLEKNFDQELDSILQSFQTEFWLIERQCYVRCHTDPEYGSACLYTLPYAFKTCPTIYVDRSNSTCLTNQTYSSYDQVKTLAFDSFLTTWASQYPIQFPSIRHLELLHPFDDIFWKMIPKFDRLTSLEIISITHDDESDRPQTQLRLLLEQSVNLYSLTIDYFVTSHLSSISINNQSIRRLDLIARDGHCYGIECLTLIQSLLNDRCEILLINIENRTIVFDLIEKLPTLRVLIFQCQDDQWGDTSVIDDELLEYFKSRLLSNHLITRDENELSILRIWIA